MAFRRITISCGIALSGVAFPTLLLAQGFALPQFGAAGTGNAFAGSAALRDDISVAYWNPAAMIDIARPTLSLAVHGLSTSSRFQSQAGTSTPPAIPTRGGDGGDAGTSALLPNAFVVLPVGDRLRFGLALGVPWGQTVEYESGWVGRFQVTKSQLVSKTAVASVSWTVSQQLSIGAGLSYTTLEADIRRNVVLGVATEGTARLEGDDNAIGGVAGALWQPHSKLRLGLAWRSSPKFSLTGRQTVLSPSGTPVPGQNFDARADIGLPSIASVSAAYELAEKWVLLADFTHMRWNALQSVPVINSTLNQPSGSSLDLLYRNGWRTSVGLNYAPNERWLLRTGVALVRSPVRDPSQRSARQPEEDRVWLGVGARWASESGNLLIDVGYLRSIVKNAAIDQDGTGVSQSGRLQGEYGSHADTLSLQATWRL